MLQCPHSSLAIDNASFLFFKKSLRNLSFLQPRAKKELEESTFSFPKKGPNANGQKSDLRARKVWLPGSELSLLQEAGGLISTFMPSLAEGGREQSFARGLHNVQAVETPAA